MLAVEQGGHLASLTPCVIEGAFGPQRVSDGYSGRTRTKTMDAALTQPVPAAGEATTPPATGASEVFVFVVYVVGTLCRCPSGPM